MAVNNLVKRLQDIMRKDAGVSGDAQRIEQMVWIFFLKVYDAQEEVWECSEQGESFVSIIPEELRWRNWAPSKDEKGRYKNDAMTGEELMLFINNKLFPVLKGNKSNDGSIDGIRVNKDTPRGQAIVQEVFQEVNQYMKNGTLLRQMIDVVDEIDFNDTSDTHTFGDIYESLLKDLQGAGRAGEFYTPRALTDFIVDRLHPSLGDRVGDFAMGTGGFLVSALEYLRPQQRSAEDAEKFQNTIVGQEWKPFPYLLGVTNILLHGIQHPDLHHMDSLGRPMAEYHDKSKKVDIIAMNPPYGGSTESSVKQNFKTEFRSSETADLFMVLIMQRLAKDGRAGVVVPDGFLFGTDGAKLNIKQHLLRNFNVHTIIRLPGSIFAPYTSIATNVIFFDNDRAEDAPEGFCTKDIWFYRMDMPEGYKHSSKTKPMLSAHAEPIKQWWDNRVEIIDEENNDEKSRCFSVEEIMESDCDFDRCKFPKDEEEILPPKELLEEYYKKRKSLEHQIDKTLQEIQDILGFKIEID